jgi:pentapeptide MXKDX repeat protein
MTSHTRIALGVATAVLSINMLLAPAAMAQDKMSKDGMKKESTMSKDGMQKDGMHKGGMMKKDSKDGMKK